MGITIIEMVIGKPPYRRYRRNLVRKLVVKYGKPKIKRPISELLQDFIDKYEY